MSLTKYLSIFFFLFCSGVGLAQKPKSYSVVTNALSQNLINAPIAKVPARLGVVPFTATKSSVQRSTQFGEYLTETIIGQAGNHSDRIKLFERTRLDAILKEQELELSDLMKPAAALKIGQLAPIDMLLSGTYTKLKSYVDVSARLLDVTTGEVLMSFTGRIKIDKNIATLFQPEQTVQSGNGAVPNQGQSAGDVTINSTTSVAIISKTQSKEEYCKKKVSDFQPRLNDLSSSAKIDAVVKEAMQTGFDNACGKLHYDVLYTFARYKIENAAYSQFLLNTLDTIAAPSNDNRAMEILRYLVTDNTITEEEWQSGLRATKRVGNYWLSNYLNCLLTKSTNTPASIQQNRIDTFFELTSAKKMGLPLPIPYEMAYFEMMEALKDSQVLQQYVYEKYAEKLVLDDKSKATFFSELRAMYNSEVRAERKSVIIDWIGDFINEQEYPKAHEQLYDFVWQYRVTGNASHDEGVKRNFPESDLLKLVNKCRDKFASYAMRTPYPSQQEDRIVFCVKYDIAVPDVIPTLAEAETILKGSNVQEQLRILKLLVFMEDKPKKIEPALVSLLERKSLEDRSTLLEAQTLAIAVLGNCKTINTKAIDFMLEALPHYGNDTEAAKIALVQIGKPAVAPIITRLNRTTIHEGGLQYQLIVLLGKIGKDAAPAKQAIKRVYDASSNGDVRYAAEAALQAIGG